jgi:hypothetical protein
MYMKLMVGKQQYTAEPRLIATALLRGNIVAAAHSSFEFALTVFAMAPSHCARYPSVTSLLREHARVGLNLDTHGMNVNAKLCEVVKDFLQAKAFAIIRESDGRPCLFSYQSDGTPILAKTTWTHRVGDRIVVRRGGDAAEFLIEKAFVRTWSRSGEPRIAVILRDPRHLAAGKNSWCLYTAAKSFFPSLKDAGATGIMISHYAFDRAMYSALSSKLRRGHLRASGLRHSDGVGEGDAWMQDNLDWVLSTPCCNHDAHNGLKWSLADHLSSSDDLKDLHIAIEALRNGYSLVHSHLPAFIREHLHFEDLSGSLETLGQFWVDIGVDADVAEALGELGLHWSDDKLMVHVEWEGNAELIERVSSALLHLFRFQKFTDSRWLTVGSSCRTIMASLCVGLHRLVATVRNDPGASQYHIHGFDRLTPSKRRFIVIASMSSVVADSFLIELLEDDRVARRSTELHRAMVDEMSWLANVPRDTWARLGRACGADESPLALRSTVLHAASVAHAFITRSVLRPLRRSPWSLAVGDIPDNIDALVAQDHVPRDPVGAKIQALARLGYSRHLLARGLEMIRDIHWSTAAGEQGHASASLMHRQHKEYAPGTIAQRAMVHMARRLLPQDDRSRGEQRAETTLRSLAAKRPNRMTGKHLFFKDACDEAKEAQGRGLTQHQKERLMRSHAVEYLRLPQAARQAYERKAALIAEQKNDALGEEADALASQINLERRRDFEEAKQRGVVLRESACRLTDDDVSKLEELWADARFSQKNVRDLRAKAMLPPTPPCQADIDALNDYELPDDPFLHNDTPQWCADVCKRRSSLRESALIISDSRGTRAYAFLYAKQQPYLAMFAPLSLVAKADLVDLATLPDEVVATVSCADYVYSVEWGSFVAEADIAIDGDAVIAVLPSLYNVDGNLMVSHAQPTLLQDVPLDPKKAAASANVDGGRGAIATAKRQRTCAFDTPLLEQHPWLQAHVQTRAVGANEAAASDDRDSAETECAATADALDDIDVEIAFRELEAKRADWAQLEDAHGRDFTTNIRGGAWTKANRKVPFDCVRACARSKAAKEFCRRYGLQDNASFAFNTYAADIAGLFALEWCRRHQWFFDLYVGQGDAKYTFGKADHDAYAEGDAFGVVVGLHPEDPGAQRVLKMRKMVPWGPRW